MPKFWTGLTTCPLENEPVGTGGAAKLPPDWAVAFELSNIAKAIEQASLLIVKRFIGLLVFV